MFKIKTKVKLCFISVLSIATGVQAGLAAQSRVVAEEAQVAFTVNVVESLSVAVTQPSADTWARGDIGTFLRNKISLTVTSNNTDGYVATMHSWNTSDLTNTTVSTSIIPTLDSAVTRSAFPYNRWGYSFDDSNSGSDTATYAGMTASTTAPIQIKSRDTAIVNDTTNIYFGAKADDSRAAGIYTNDVVISVVTGKVTPETPPVVPGEDKNPNDGKPTYLPDKNASVSTSTSNTGVSSTIISGEYTKPLGVTETTSYTSNVATGTSLATGLLVASATAATSGFLFFLLAKRRKDDDEEEEL